VKNEVCSLDAYDGSHLRIFKTGMFDELKGRKTRSPQKEFSKCFLPTN
jgi:hypothetical protein